jgi:hypothetical protein
MIFLPVDTARRSHDVNKAASILKIAIAATTFAFAASGVGATTAQRMPASAQVDQASRAAGSVVSAAAPSYYVVP